LVNAWGRVQECAVWYGDSRDRLNIALLEGCSRLKMHVPCSSSSPPLRCRCSGLGSKLTRPLSWTLSPTIGWVFNSRSSTDMMPLIYEGLQRSVRRESVAGAWCTGGCWPIQGTVYDIRMSSEGLKVAHKDV
jgi:hypothetical protein